MLLTFKSKGAADVLMYEAHAKRILDLLHKDSKMGVITAAETADAVTVLEKVIANSRSHDTNAHHNESGDDNGHEHADHVSFANRAYPLLDMLRAAQKGNYDVLWGV
jgi:IS30 family transposase